MVRETKLGALLRGREIDERSAIQHRNQVGAIVQERQEMLNALEIKRDAVLKRVSTLISKNRYSALQAGDISQVSSITRYSKRLEAELERLEKQIGERRRELGLAKEREGLAEEDVVAARIERKKIEKLLSNRENIELRKKVAREESRADEMATYRGIKDRKAD